MGVYIKGIEMPKDCNNCKFFDDNYDYPTCSVTDNSRGYNWNPRGQRMPDCPLIDIPPHRRLIDADALLKLLDSCMFPSDMVTTRALSMATNWLKEAPTIIEAEEES